MPQRNTSQVGQPAFAESMRVRTFVLISNPGDGHLSTTKVLPFGAESKAVPKVSEEKGGRRTRMRRTEVIFMELTM
jgi:hypothetical protein